MPLWDCDVVDIDKLTQTLAALGVLPSAEAICDAIKEGVKEAIKETLEETQLLHQYRGPAERIFDAVADGTRMALKHD
jgi:hypothetical protein